MLSSAESTACTSSKSSTSSKQASVRDSSSSLDSLRGFGCLNLKTNEDKTTENPIATITKRTETIKTTTKTSKDSKYMSFIESLTLKLDDESRRDPEALDYIKNFNQDKNCKINLLHKCYSLFNESIFGNKLPAQMPLFWNGKLTSSGGYCKKSIKDKKSYVEIHISVKVSDNPGI